MDKQLTVSFQYVQDQIQKEGIARLIYFGEPPIIVEISINERGKCVLPIGDNTREKLKNNEVSFEFFLEDIIRFVLKNQTKSKIEQVKIAKMSSAS